MDNLCLKLEMSNDGIFSTTSTGVTSQTVCDNSLTYNTVSNFSYIATDQVVHYSNTGLPIGDSWKSEFQFVEDPSVTGVKLRIHHQDFQTRIFRAELSIPTCYSQNAPPSTNYSDEFAILS